ncbi:sensor histidine kinase [Niabella aquatica]
MRIYKIFLLFFCCFVAAGNILAQGAMEIKDATRIYKPAIGQIEYLEDKDGSLTLDNIEKTGFKPYPGKVPNFFISHSVFWVKIKIANYTNDTSFLINVGHPTLNNVVFYTKDSGGPDSIRISEEAPFRERLFKNQNLIFPISIKKGGLVTCYFKFNASEQILFPVDVGARQVVLDDLALKDLIFGIYVGLILFMLLYNSFLYASTKDASYFYYVAYIIFVGLSQCMLQGYTFRFLWPNHPSLNNYAAVIIPFFNGIAAAEFIKSFLNLRQLSRRIYIGLNIVEMLYLVSFILCILGFWQEAQLAVQLVASLGATYMLAALLSLRKFRGAQILIIAWSLFLGSVVVFVLRNIGVLPYNNFTYYALQFGSSLEAILLSIALADKINIYRKNSLEASKENERLIKDQNIILEKQVHERTLELEAVNTNLNQTLSQLKDAQSKLVESEKMVSLGQLTAGIAHEINNPINFVTSNVKPLELDISDIQSLIQKYEEIDPSKNIEEQLSAINSYKKQIDLEYINEEITTLLTGIRDGANRTAEIVSNLKNFARIDEANVKFANLNEGIQSTLMLVKNAFPKDFVLKKEFGSIPDVECTPGKINQVFMNIITNGLQSIAERQEANPGTGILTIRTTEENGHVKISIKDNGTGIKEGVREKIFEPFYTTKPVGQGTGLGMSIVKGIIDSHKGTIEVISNFGEGAEFVITLPVNYLA